MSRIAKPPGYGRLSRWLHWIVAAAVLPMILAGLTQCIMLSLSMVVIAALVGAGGLGVPVVRALNSVRVDTGFEAGLIIVLLAIIGSFQVFDLVQVLTNGGPYFATEVVNTYIYHLAFGGFGGATVAALSMTVVPLASAAAISRFSVAPTLGKSSQTEAPVRRGAVATR